MNKARKIADMAIFTAIGVVLNIMSFSTFEVLGRMSLVYAFCYTVGILYGPVLGACIAMISDLIPALVLPQGAPINPLINLGVGLMAFIVGFCVHLKKGNITVKFTLGVVLSFIIVTLGINAFGESLMFNLYPNIFPRSIGAALGIDNPYLMVMLSKAARQPFWIVGNAALVYVVVYRLRNIISFRYGLNFFERKRNIQPEE